jgi:phosphate transport system protein
MTIHFHRELDNLKKMILSVAAEVEESLQSALRALDERSKSLSQKVIENDKRIDMREIEVEEECLKILALHQPVAVDLRYIIAVLKINSDLERVGDLAVNIAERALYLSSQVPVKIPNTIIKMSNEVREMLKKSIDANYKLHLLGVSRYLERIADHSTNIAEDVIYMVKGEISRHKYGS